MGNQESVVLTEAKRLRVEIISGRRSDLCQTQLGGEDEDRELTVRFSKREAINYLGKSHFSRVMKTSPTETN